MGEKERNDYFYVCALIEYIARETRNHRGDIVRTIGKKGNRKIAVRCGGKSLSEL